jgi:hypothetical protein
VKTQNSSGDLCCPQRELISRCLSGHERNWDNIVHFSTIQRRVLRDLEILSSLPYQAFPTSTLQYIPAIERHDVLWNRVTPAEGQASWSISLDILVSERVLYIIALYKFTIHCHKNRFVLRFNFWSIFFLHASGSTIRL